MEVYSSINGTKGYIPNLPSNLSRGASNTGSSLTRHASAENAMDTVSFRYNTRFGKAGVVSTTDSDSGVPVWGNSEQGMLDTAARSLAEAIRASYALDTQTVVGRVISEPFQEVLSLERKKAAATGTPNAYPMSAGRFHL